jgi:stage V sporulation protein SpoVS
MEKPLKSLSVSAGTSVVKLSDSIFANLKTGNDVELVAVGAYSVNQMNKALAIARGKFSQSGKNIAWYSYFSETPGKTDGKTLTGLCTRVIFV